LLLIRQQSVAPPRLVDRAPRITLALEARMFFVANDYTWLALFVAALREGALFLAPVAVAVAAVCLRATSSPALRRATAT
jgi:hypothetical protein